MTRLLILFGLLGLRLAAHASHPAAIASAHPLATEAGHQILQAGGNAFDAAVAVAAVLGVVEPGSSGLGGGGFWLLHRASDGKDVMIDAREAAPGMAMEEMYLDHEGQVDREWATNGPLAAGIPGQAAAFAHLAEHYGNLPLEESLAPAIQLANEGFRVTEAYRRLSQKRQTLLAGFPEARRLFLDRGSIPAKGYVLRQTDLAATLSRLAEQGHKGFYTGETATKLVNGVQGGGGIWTLEDLASYRVIERDPVVGEYRGMRITTAALPSSGGMVLLQTLNILSNFGDLQRDKGLTTHLVAEALRRSYRDRAKHLGDPDFVSVPAEKLLSQDYAVRLSATIDLTRATASKDLGDLLEQPDNAGTSHLSVLDREGNRVAATLSINLPFGSGFIPPETGVLLNNEMDDFSAKPGAPNAYGLLGSEANAIAPGKRPLSSMTPTFLEWDDKVAILGTPGGSRIISMVLLAVLDAHAGHPPEYWVSRPRYHHQYLPDEVQAEPVFIGGESARQLLLRGHDMQSTGRPYGNMQAIVLNKSSGQVSAAADPRGEGKAEVR